MDFKPGYDGGLNVQKNGGVVPLDKYCVFSINWRNILALLRSSDDDDVCHCYLTIGVSVMKEFL